MGLPPDEPRTLREIESQLARSDPSLATMLAVFTVDPSRARECSRPVPPRPARAKHVAVLIVLTMLFLMCTTMAAITAP
jgi:hypothetical protein